MTIQSADKDDPPWPDPVEAEMMTSGGREGEGEWQIWVNHDRGEYGSDCFGPVQQYAGVCVGAGETPEEALAKAKKDIEAALLALEKRLPEFNALLEKQQKRHKHQPDPKTTAE
jgi:predicted RNase H-like HicB family nuclease